MNFTITLRYSLEEVKMALLRLSNTPPGPQDARLTQSPDFITKIRMFTAQQSEHFRQPDPLSPNEHNAMIVSVFEEDLWKNLNLEGVLVPEVLFKECQRRLRDGQSRSPPSTYIGCYSLEFVLELLGEAHRQRKKDLGFYHSPSRMGDWMTLRSIPPSDEMRRLGPHFWALIIGNDNYAAPAHPLGGSVNDARLIRDYIKNYLAVPDHHIRFLQNASRSTIINNLYKLRDDARILRGDNILIHFSGHGTSYDASQYFKGPLASKGSIEAICPIDRGLSVPDISDRELNSILLEVRAEKGQNITLILDCCHAGGSLRHYQPQVPGYATRYLHPLRTEGHLDLKLMLNAGDNNKRRGRYTPSISSEDWEGSFDGFVQLASCHDFQLAREADFYHSDGPTQPTERVNAGFDSTLQELELPSNSFPRGRAKPSVAGTFKPIPPKPQTPSTFPQSHVATASMPTAAHPLPHITPPAPATAHSLPHFTTSALPPYYEQPKIQPSPPRYGCFTWALVKVLESEIGKNGTYESVIKSIGNLSVTQDPVLLGKRKVSRLWYRE